MTDHFYFCYKVTAKLNLTLIDNVSSPQKEFQIGLPSLSSHLGDLAQIPLTTKPRIGEIAGVVSGKLIHFTPLWQM